jgi:hypothetical protein
MLLILALPDFQLPDTALHRTTIPVVMPSHGAPGLATLAVTSSVRFVQRVGACRLLPDRRILATDAAAAPNFLPILLQTLRR